MESRPLSFPNLPLYPGQGQWSHDVQEAYKIIRETYDHASQILRREEYDNLRLHTLSESIVEDTIPLLEELDLEVADNTWAETAARALAATLVDLERMAAASQKYVVLKT